MDYKKIERAVLQYWTRLCAGRPMPLRSEVDPRGFEKVLDHVFTLELSTDGIIRFRVTGAHLNTVAGREVSAMPAAHLFAPAMQPHAMSHLETVFKGPAHLSLTIRADHGHRGEAGRLMALPLRGTSGWVNRALGTFAMPGDHQDIAGKIQIVTAREIPIPIMPDRAMRNHGPPEGMAEPASTYRAGRKRPALRLVHDRDASD